MSDMLERFFAHQMPGVATEIVELRNTSLGRSRENWSFDLIWSDRGRSGKDPLILRRDPLGGLVETDRAKEFSVLQALSSTAVPAPPGRWLDAEGRWFGRPSLIMGRKSGVCDYFLLGGARPLDQRLKLAYTMCNLLAEVHLVDWKGVGLGAVLKDPGPDAARAQLEEWREVFERDRLESYPEIDLVIRWLGEHAPISQATVLVHSDFKPGNVLVEEDRVVALLDWELAHLGDPLEDVGWVTQPLRQREQMIPKVWEREQILSLYTQLTGFEIDDAALRWWNLFATFRTAVMQVSGLRSFVEGRSNESYRPTAKVLGALLDALDVEETRCGQR
jgi:aminoglycoside phosphotransferase (APT) family kinase protein